jgi:hypothetical protein
MFCEHSQAAAYQREILSAFPSCTISLGVMTLTGSWGGACQWLFNNFETYLLLHFGAVNQVHFNPLKLEDYCLAFGVPWPLAQP